MVPPLSKPADHAFLTRQERLRARIENQKLSLLIVTNPSNIFYLTGFRGSAGVAVLGPSDARLWVDPRYTLQAREQAHGVEVIEARTSLLSVVGQWIRSRKAHRVGYDDGHLTCAEFRTLRERSASKSRGAAWERAGGINEELRVVKDASEIELIRQAGQLTAAVFEEIRPLARPGAREADLAAEIEYRLRRNGAEGVAFETIVASGARGALPHARASSKRLEAGELVIFDLGAILGGYAADMTRTMYLGTPRRRVQRLYAAVLEAERAAVEAVRAGVRASDVDAAARRALKRRDLDRYFTHSTGHGVGIEVHEQPRLGRGEKSRLEAGSVVTVEPGIYLEGFGGIRIEDTVLVGPNGAEVLTPAAKDNWAVR
ncbi:MAG TPA: Xaa-Pro peptidase family protein [Terriglobia bacterium]|nr:Xaa-Pro peptidase family protein [Terriglobia bacterium]